MLLGPTSRSGRGFNLIEAAIVLAVVGLVIGGIWTAAAATQRNVRINEMGLTILQVANGIRGLMPRSAYPTLVGSSTSVTGTAFHAKLFPSSFTLNASQTIATSSTGVTFSTTLACWSPCPMINVTIIGPAHASGGKLSAADCTQIIRRFAGLAKDRSNLIYAQLTIPGNSGYLYLNPPINPAAVQCPENLEYAHFWFSP